MSDAPPPVRCPRCQQWKEIYTVPIRLAANEPGWQVLCRDCFVDVLEVEPSPDLGFRIIKRRRSRGW